VRNLLDVVFECSPKSGEEDPVIQRHFLFVNEDAYELSSNPACYDFELYGGANADAIEFDDPTPIPDRGYWFNGECKFLTLEGFVPSLSLFYQAWLKPHHTQGTLFEYTPVHPANADNSEYNWLGYSDDDYLCYESHAQAEEHCIHAHFELYEWHTYRVARSVYEGFASYDVQIDGVAGGEWTSSSDDLSNLRIYPEVDFTFGASMDYFGGGLLDEWYFKGFQYTLRFGVEYGGEPNYDGPIQWSNGDDICTCDSDDCPLTEGCLGVCNWNYFWDGVANKCTRCPYWCHEGCSTNGSC